MNPIVLRALLWRGGLAVGVLALCVGFAASTPTQPPWAPFLLFFGGFLTFGVIASLLTDRKLAVRSGREDAPWNGSAASWRQQAIAVDGAEASEIARRAIANVGGRQVEPRYGGSVVTGWIGSSLTNIPEWQEYELAVVASSGPNGETLLTCCARPRWIFNWGGSSKSQRLAESLRSQVEWIGRHG